MFGLLGNQGEGFGHRFLIREIVRLTGCQTYLELGTYDGTTFEYIFPQVKRGICVDIVDIRRSKLGEFYKMTTDEFFTKFQDGVDVVFIDADHKFESVNKDFENSLKLLNKYGIIILHDTDPISLQYTDPGYCGDSYKMVEYIEKEHPELNILTIPVTDTGISIVSRKGDRRVLTYIK